VCGMNVTTGVLDVSGRPQRTASLARLQRREPWQPPHCFSRHAVEAPAAASVPQ
jgi:hypothetical protein